MSPVCLLYVSALLWVTSTVEIALYWMQHYWCGKSSTCTVSFQSPLRSAKNFAACFSFKWHTFIHVFSSDVKASALSKHRCAWDDELLNPIFWDMWLLSPSVWVGRVETGYDDKDGNDDECRLTSQKSLLSSTKWNHLSAVSCNQTLLITDEKKTLYR